MSLPIPSSSGPGVPLDPKQLQALDAPLIALTEQCGGDLRRLMFAFFSFLHRRTDFYLVPHPDDVQEGKPVSMGFKQGDAEKLLIAAFRQFPLRRIPKGQAASAPPTAAAASAVATSSTAKVDATATTPTAAPRAAKCCQPSSSKTKPTPADSVATTTTDTASTSIAKNMQDVKYNPENGLQIPVGNGGSTKTYKWTQTLEECTVLVGVPKNLRGKDLDVSITPSTLSIKAKKPIVLEDSSSPTTTTTTMTTFLEGNLSQKVRPDESTWTVEGGVVIVTLDKLVKTFWHNVLERDEKIDTELVDNRRHISDYDDATQGQIRKIMFDQQQYHKGGPTSDEILQKEQQSSSLPLPPNSSLSSTTIPPLPKGVEYIDKKTLDDHEKKIKESQQQEKK